MINLKNVTPLATKRFRESYSAIIDTLLTQLRSNLVRFESSGGTISSNVKRIMIMQVGDAVQRVYVGSDLRHAYGLDGATPQSAYAAALNDAFAEVIALTVLRYQTELRNTLPPDLFERLARATTSNVVSEGLFSGSTPYVTPFTWVDPNGNVLSDRIWKVSLQAREAVDRIVSQGIRNGDSASTIARKLELYLKPEANVPTRLPYGRSASFPAMRLARTEISHAMNEASLASLRLHPYYDRVDIVRSGRGDPNCKICQDHASINIAGTRVRESYSLDNVPSVPLHPHCLCHFSADDRVPNDAQRLRERIDEIEPYANPASGSYFINLLLGSVLSRLLPNILGRIQNG